MIIYLDKDPKFYYGGYPESGTTEYDGPGWYIWDHAGAQGPFGTEQEARNKQVQINKEKD